MQLISRIDFLETLPFDFQIPLISRRNFLTSQRDPIFICIKTALQHRQVYVSVRPNSTPFSSVDSDRPQVMKTWAS